MNSNSYFSSFSRDDNDGEYIYGEFDNAKMHGSLHRMKCSKDTMVARDEDDHSEDGREGSTD